NRIDKEAVLGMDRLVAGRQIGVRQKVQDLVRAGAADNARRVKTEGPPDRLAQAGCRPVGIELEMLARCPIGGDRLRTRAERRLMRGQVEGATAAGPL